MLKNPQYIYIYSICTQRLISAEEWTEECANETLEYHLDKFSLTIRERLSDLKYNTDIGKERVVNSVQRLHYSHALQKLDN